jgi:NAD dependent epimerase/dehydratase family enzyme
MSWIHVDDVVELLLFAATNDAASGPLNASSPEPVTNALFTRELAGVLRRPAIFTAPKFALKIALGEMADFLFDSLRVIPQETERAGFQFHHPTLKGTLQNVLF